MKHRFRFVIFVVLLLATWLLLRDSAGRAVPPIRPLSVFPVFICDWKLVAQEFFDAPVLQVLKPTDYLSRRYQSADGSTVHLYVGYHDGGSDSGEIHSPRHCLPGTGWYQMHRSLVTIPTLGGDIHAVRSIYQKGEARELFYYWYQVRGDTLDNEFALKLSAITGALLHGRRDAGFVRVSIPLVVDEANADAAVVSFIRSIYPELCRFLPGFAVHLPAHAEG